MKDIIITINGGETINVSPHKTYFEILKEQNALDGVIGITVNNKVVSMNDTLELPCNIKTLDIHDTCGNRIYVAGLKMLFECSLYKLYKGIKVSYLYSIPKGIVASIDYKDNLTKDDILKIKKEMSLTIGKDLQYEKLSIKSSDAAAFYDKLHNEVKKLNIKYITDPTVVLYRLGNCVNYYYSEMPYSTSVIDDFDIKLLKDNKIVITCPMDGDDRFIPEYSKFKSINTSYDAGIKWLNVMNVPYIANLNELIFNGKIKKFINSCELNFDREIGDVADQIVKDKSKKCIMLSGPSASGKTTVIKRLASYLALYGVEPIVISLDGYFKERVDTPKDENGEYDFECLEALDLDYLNSDMIKLFNGEEITLPDFNFVTGKKELTQTKAKLKENSLVLFEGLHAINDNLLPMIPNNIKFKIYVSPFIPLAIDEHNYITDSELRLIRRILRDFTTRGYSVETTIKNCRKVHIGEEKHIIPLIGSADVLLNTSLSYEVGVLKVLIEPLLYAVSQDSEYYNEARRLLSFLKQFFPITSEYVNKDSLIREFIGGYND